MTTASTGDDATSPRAGNSRLATIATVHAAQGAPAFNGIAEQLQRILAPVNDRMAESLLASAFPNLNDQMRSLFHDVARPVGPDWSAHISDILNAAMGDTRSRQDLFCILDRFDEIARNNPDLDDLVADDADADLGEIGEEGLAFVNAEGVGLSWEMRRRLFLAFVYLAVFGTLMTAIVSSETASGLLEDGAVPAAAATAVLVVAKREWEKKVPRPEGDAEEGSDGE
ncbi:hypothetical protein [Streptomyces rubiginosohelvolus]|uniref:hypothetical protein n=1 Tax=Streptomyces rubiginosohelvolus TaxID=67362 RepID=UPI0033EE6749